MSTAVDDAARTVMLVPARPVPAASKGPRPVLFGIAIATAGLALSALLALLLTSALFGYPSGGLA